MEYDPVDGRVWGQTEESLIQLASKMNGDKRVRSVGVSRCHAREGHPNERYALAITWSTPADDANAATIVAGYMEA